MINVQIGQLILVNAHHVILLRSNQPTLNLSPGDGIQFVIINMESLVEKAFNVPILKELVEYGQRFEDPKAKSNQEE